MGYAIYKTSNNTITINEFQILDTIIMYNSVFYSEFLVICNTDLQQMLDKGYDITFSLYDNDNNIIFNENIVNPTQRLNTYSFNSTNGVTETISEQIIDNNAYLAINDINLENKDYYVSITIEKGSYIKEVKGNLREISDYKTISQNIYYINIGTNNYNTVTNGYYLEGTDYIGYTINDTLLEQTNISFNNNYNTPIRDLNKDFVYNQSISYSLYVPDKAEYNETVDAYIYSNNIGITLYKDDNDYLLSNIEYIQTKMNILFDSISLSTSSVTTQQYNLYIPVFYDNITSGLSIFDIYTDDNLYEITVSTQSYSNGIFTFTVVYPISQAFSTNLYVRLNDGTIFLFKNLEYETI